MPLDTDDNTAPRSYAKHYFDVSICIVLKVEWDVDLYIQDQIDSQYDDDKSQPNTPYTPRTPKTPFSALTDLSPEAL